MLANLLNVGRHFTSFYNYGYMTESKREKYQITEKVKILSIDSSDKLISL